MQMAGVYQFLLRVRYLGVSHGTSAVMATGTVLIAVTRPDAPVSLQFCLKINFSFFKFFSHCNSVGVSCCIKRLLDLT